MATSYFKFLNYKLFDPTKWDISFAFLRNLKTRIIYDLHSISNQGLHIFSLSLPPFLT